MSLIKRSEEDIERRRVPDTPAHVLKAVHCQQEKYYVKEDDRALVYLLHVSPSGELPYHKIGFTRHSVKFRFLKENIPSYRTICQIELALAEAQLLEKTLHDAFSSKRVTPTHRFGGWTECFHLDETDILWISQAFQKLRLST